MDGGPAVGVVGVVQALALLHEGLEGGGTTMLDVADPVEETGALGFEHGVVEFGCWLRGFEGGDGRVEGVQHGDAVVLVEGREGELVDEDLMGASAVMREWMWVGMRANPSAQANV